jgi:UDP-GlcNAc:undecaprenyl-phosphate GlcNAc-1-phosphate transferase
VPGTDHVLAIIGIVFASSVACTWLMRAVARNRKWLAPPRPDRWHREPTALFGGVSIYAVFITGIVALVPWSLATAGLIGLTTLMFATGLLDDARELRPQTKIVLQLTSGLLLYVVGFHFNSAIAWGVDLVIVVFWTVAITNAMNLLDNMNGLAAGTAVIAGVFRLLLFLQTGNLEGALAAAVFVGAVGGFLVFNFPRATIFMGDSGSFTVGFALAALNLSSSEAYSKTLFSILVFPVLVLAIPLFDTTFVSVVRYFSGRSISQGGRDHTSHRLVAIGLSETTAVLMLWGLSAAGGFVAYLLYNVGFSYAIFVAALLALGLSLLGVVLARVRVYPEGAEDAAASNGFALPGELRYKRQALWVMLDAGTIGTAFLAAALATRTTPDPTAFAVHVAAMLLLLFAGGLYRIDWTDFGYREVAIISTAAVLSTVVTWGASRALPAATAVPAPMLMVGLVAVAVGLCGTRFFVRALDGHLRAIGRGDREA